MGIATLLNPWFKIDMLHVCFEMLLGDESIIDAERKVWEKSWANSLHTNIFGLVVPANMTSYVILFFPSIGIPIGPSCTTIPSENKPF